MLDIIFLLRKAFPNELIMGFTLRIKYKKLKPKKNPPNPSMLFATSWDGNSVKLHTPAPPSILLRQRRDSVTGVPGLQSRWVRSSRVSRYRGRGGEAEGHWLWRAQWEWDVCQDGQRSHVQCQVRTQELCNPGQPAWPCLPQLPVSKTGKIILNSQDCSEN